jgi:FdhD protein
MSQDSYRIQKYPAVKLEEGNLVAVEQLVSEEAPLTIYLNGKELVTMLCSPNEEKYITLGFLVSEGMIHDIEAITDLTIDSERGFIWVEADTVFPNVANTYLKRCLTACCGRGRTGFYFANDARTIKSIESNLKISAAEILSYSLMLEELSATYHMTHGVHCGALAAKGEFLLYSEDIGRHNVFDKIYGKCLEMKISTADKVVVFSGRISSEILIKVSKMAIPLIIARAVPTSLAIGLAEDLGITLVGAAKGESFFVYTHTGRVTA